MFNQNCLVVSNQLNLKLLQHTTNFNSTRLNHEFQFHKARYYNHAMEVNYAALSYTQKDNLLQLDCHAHATTRLHFNLVVDATCLLQVLFQAELASSKCLLSGKKHPFRSKTTRKL